ncbi:protocadherin gamma subfamily C 4 [Cricetulus griseus]
MVAEARSSGLVSPGRTVGVLLLLAALTKASTIIHYEILEEREKGFPVGNVVTDLGLDLGSLSARRLRVVSGASRRFFEVNWETGEMFVNDRLDREELCGTLPSCTVTLELVVENPLELFSAEVVVQDINDNNPSFPTGEMKLEISEAMAPGTRFPLESAHDPDVGSNSLQTYELSHNEYFALRVQTREDGTKYAELVLERALDWEREPNVQLVLTAVDGGTPARSASLPIRITVLDANDNAPTFNQSLYRARVREDAPPGTRVAQVRATDLDEGLNGEIVYSFGSHNRAGVRELFALDLVTGVLTIKGRLDFEDTKLYEIYIQAKDKGANPEGAHCKVLVEVVDVNDNAPEITVTSVYSPVPEDAPLGTVIALLSVTDLDAGENGLVTCEVPPGLPFSLTSSLKNYFTLKTSAALDRETMPEYNLSITARDSGTPSLSALTTVRVQVSDVNDNPPQSSQSSYDVYVEENTPPGVPILNLSVWDPDAPHNARLSFFLLEPGAETGLVGRYFTINRDSGVLTTLVPLDYEGQREFQLTAHINDGGTPVLATNVSVNIFVTDRNDNAPQVLYPRPGQSSVEMLPRGTAAGHVVSRVVGWDADAGHNAWLSYSLLGAPNQSLFAVGLHTGQISTARPVQDTDSPRQILTVLISDNGEPLLSTTATLTVSVTEETPEARAEFPSGSAPREQNKNLTFYLLLSLILVSVGFAVTVLGVIIFKVYKWKRSRDLYRAPVSSLYRTPGPSLHADAVRGGLMPPHLYHQVYLTTDSRRSDPLLKKPGAASPLASRQNTLRSCDPVFYRQVLGAESAPPGQIRYPVPEESQEGTFVGNVAQDFLLDTESLSARRLQVAGEVNQRHFRVDLDSGALLIKNPIDREALCGLSASCIVPLEFVTEGPLEMYRAEVEIVDVNDHAPRFPRQQLDLEIGEAAPPGQRFPLEKAQDADVGSNSISSYRLSSNEHFALDVKKRSDGSLVPELLLEKPLDREKQSDYRLVLTAVDGGNPPRSGTAELRVSVLDVNDNAPAFQQSSYRISVLESAPAGMVLIQLNASDPDLGPSGNVTFSFSGHTPDRVRNLFSLHPTTGKLTLQGPLDFESENYYEFDVRARDGGSPAMEQHCSLRVDLLDVNDNAPHITVTSELGTLPESAEPGTVVALISVQDPDSGSNGDVSLRIPDHLPFALKSAFRNQFSLVTAGPLDREARSSYDIMVTASDAGNPPLSTHRTIFLNISDVNDNPPSFFQRSHEVFVPENNRPGDLLCSLAASDPDSGLNALISYSLLEPRNRDVSASSFISLNPQTGAVHATRSFDYEQTQTLQFEVQARDRGSPPLSSTVTVRLFVLDLNDNAPAVLRPRARPGSLCPQALPPSVGAGHLVTKVTAVDLDSGYNAWVSYQLLEAPDPSLFAVSRYAGEVRTAVPIPADLPPQKLVIVVKDSGTPPLSTSVTLLVSLEEDTHPVVPDLRESSAPREGESRLTLYLAVSLVAICFVSFGSFVALLSKCLRGAACGVTCFPAGTCACLTRSRRREGLPPSNGILRIQLGSEDPIKFVDVGGHSHGCTPLASAPTRSDSFMMVKSPSAPMAGEPVRPSCPPSDLLYGLEGELDAVNWEQGGGWGASVTSWGEAVVNLKIDRESLCGASSSCLLPVQVVTEHPLELIRVEVEVLDLNDNSPSFATPEREMRISESAAPGARFPLDSAQDPDVGTNTVSFYTLTPNSHFSLNVKTLKDGKLFPELVLEQQLDREAQARHQLVLTAMDGGTPARSGTSLISVIVLDINDNAPAFQSSVLRVGLPENTPPGTLLLRLNATDPDEGTNGQLDYSFGDHTSEAVKNLFGLDPSSGAIHVLGPVDFEESNFYEIHARARDQGQPAMEGHCVIQVDVGDANDNPPEVLLASLVNPVLESTPVGTVVGLFNVRDRDSGRNGEVNLDISPDLPFQIKPSENHYSLLTSQPLDREATPHYIIDLLASDAGSPPLHTHLTIRLNISDANDNAPHFTHQLYTAYIPENRPPGSLLCTVAASDPDMGDNARLAYSIVGSQIQGAPASSFVYVNPEDGRVFAQRTFDYELLQMLQIVVGVRDSGSPPLHANTSLHVFVLDQNDNAPTVLHPRPGRELSAPQRLPRSAPPGSLVTKVTAVDADAGHNAWLSYSLLPQSTAPGLFLVSAHTGEVRTARALLEEDSDTQQVVVLVRDNGDPSLSSTATVLLVLEDEDAEEMPKSNDFLTRPPERSDLTLYLIVALAAVSLLSLVTFTFMSAKCLKGHEDGDRGGGQCCRGQDSPSREFYKQSSPNLQVSSDGTLKYMEVTLRPTDSQSHCYRTCFSPASDGSDFTFLRPLSVQQPSALALEAEALRSCSSTLRERSQQAPPNTDWRFSQAQRPGTSGSQNGDETGTWPNNQFDTEMLQAMILASASEAADGSSTLGGGAGTMGLSARYGPQFTLQHVPDYRQNVYIPGSNATLTNAAGKRDGKAPAGGNGNKKKSGKKEKK